MDKAYEMGLIRHVFHSDPMDEPISREEFCAVALRFVETQAQVDVLPDIINYERAERNEDGKCVPVFRDMPQDNQRSYEISAAFYLGVVEGRGSGRFDPDANITREEAAVMLTRAYRVLDSAGLEPRTEKLSFTDQDTISSWARESASVLLDWDVMHGTGQGAFEPKESYTREQCVVTFLRLYENPPVSRKNNNIPKPFTYDQVMDFFEAYFSGGFSYLYQENFTQVACWEGPKATVIRDSIGSTVPSTSTCFVYRDGRVRYFDLGLRNVGGVLTRSVKLTGVSFSEDVELFFCTATLPSDTYMDENILTHRAGIYYIVVNVETLEVQHAWEPLPAEHMN